MSADADLKEGKQGPFINLFFFKIFDNFDILLFIHDLIYPFFVQNYWMSHSWNSATF